MEEGAGPAGYLSFQDAAGNWFASTAKRVVLLATGQSNFQVQENLAWTPAKTARRWNNVRNSDGSVGTALVPFDATKINTVESYVHHLAAARPEHDYYVLTVAIGGQPIAQWMPGASAPDMYNNILLNIEDFLTAVDADKIDMMLWRQGESDAGNNIGLYPGNFETVMGRFYAETWFPRTTPVVIFGLVPYNVQIAGGASVNVARSYADVDAALQYCAGEDPDNRTFVRLSSLGSDYWTAPTNIHNNAAGYWESGKLAANQIINAARSTTKRDYRQVEQLAYEGYGNADSVGVGNPFPAYPKDNRRSDNPPNGILEYWRNNKDSGQSVEGQFLLTGLFAFGHYNNGGNRFAVIYGRNRTSAGTEVFSVTSAGLFTVGAANNRRPVALSDYQSITTDADATLTPLVSPYITRLQGSFGTRTMTLSNTGAFAGCRFHIFMPPASSGSWDIGGLITLTPGKWCEVVTNGSGTWWPCGAGPLTF